MLLTGLRRRRRPSGLTARDLASVSLFHIQNVDLYVYSKGIPKIRLILHACRVILTGREWTAA